MNQPKLSLAQVRDRIDSIMSRKPARVAGVSR